MTHLTRRDWLRLTGAVALLPFNGRAAPGGRPVPRSPFPVSRGFQISQLDQTTAPAG